MSLVFRCMFGGQGDLVTQLSTFAISDTGLKIWKARVKIYGQNLLILKSG